MGAQNFPTADQNYSLDTDWLLLRTTSDLNDDTDHLDVQTDFLADVSLMGECIRVGFSGQSRAGGAAQVLGLQLFVAFLDSSDDVITPNAGSGKGSYDVEAYKIVRGVDGDGDAVTYVVDSAALTSCDGYRVQIIDGLAGDLIWLRLSNITGPTGGAKAQIWVTTSER